ncbi:MAG: cobalamin-independent methionine synthase II family protein [Ilumatobacteraceae bacterium]
MPRAIPSTHTGSLPRPDDLIKTMWALGDGVPLDPAKLEARFHTAIDEIVKKQIEAGVTVINDGEMTKPSYATYVKDRLSGFNGESVRNYHFQDLVDYPRSAEAVNENPGRQKRNAPACTGLIEVIDKHSAVRDMEWLAGAAKKHGHDRIFTSAASPGVISIFFANQYYKTQEEYVFAIAEAMRFEYEAIANAGATVQLDCPDLAMGRHSAYASLSLEEFRKTIALNVEALNHAVRNIPEEQLRMHLCWGNYPGPHNHDVPITDIIDIVWKAKPPTVLFEGANPRHAHEWHVLKELGVPNNKTICPGVIEPQSNYIEHPELIAQRLVQWGEVVDPERLMAGVDCGFSVHVGIKNIDPDVVFSKLASLAEGCERAGARLFR